MSGLCWAHVGLCWAYVGPCCLLGATLAYVGPALAHVEALALALSLRSSLLLLLLLLALLALFALLASDFFPYALPLALAGVGGYMLRWSTWNNRWQNVNQ